MHVLLSAVVLFKSVLKILDEKNLREHIMSFSTSYFLTLTFAKFELKIGSDVIP